MSSKHRWRLLTWILYFYYENRDNECSCPAVMCRADEPLDFLSSFPTCSHGATQRNNRHGRLISPTYIPNLSLYRTIEASRGSKLFLFLAIFLREREKKNDQREKRNICNIPFIYFGKESTRFRLIEYHDNQFMKNRSRIEAHAS